MNKAIRLTTFILLGFVIILTTNCASILNDNPEHVFITTSPENAEVYIDGNSAGTGTVQAWLDSSRDHFISAKLGDKEATVAVTSHIGVGWLVADIFLTGLLGIVIDAVTEDWKELHVPPGGHIHITLH